MELSTLLKEHKYNEIIKVTKDKNDVDSVSYRINAFIALNNYKEALKEIVKHNDMLYKNNPLKTMELHIELLLELEMYIEAINAHHDYSERPYISQPVEEFLREVPNRIVKSKKSKEASELYNDEDKVKEIFTKSKDDALLTNAIYHLKKLDITPYLSSLLILLKRNDVSDDVKTLALLILVMKHVDYNLTMIKREKEYKVNPINLVAPYLEVPYKEIMQLIINISKDPTIESVATNLFNQYVLNVFPGDIYNAKSQTMAVAFIALAKRYLKAESEVDQVIKSANENIDEVRALMDQYQNNIEIKNNN